MSRFITLEGIDGTGKSTICALLKQALEERGHKVWTTMEPSDSWLGGLVKESFSKDISPFSEALLFCADRAEHTRQIVSRLGEGTNVLCDRYVDSTIAYQGAVLRPYFPGEDLLDWLSMVNEPYIRKPDLTLLLKADPEICLERVGTREDTTKFERLELLRQVQANYLELSRSSDRFVMIDAGAELEEVSERVLSEVRRLIEGLED